MTLTRGPAQVRLVASHSHTRTLYINLAKALTLMSAAGRFFTSLRESCLSSPRHPPPRTPAFIVISPPSSLFGPFSAFYLLSARFSIEISLSRRPPREKGASFMRTCFISSFNPLALSPSVMLILCQKYILSWTRSRGGVLGSRQVKGAAS